MGVISVMGVMSFLRPNNITPITLITPITQHSALSISPRS